MKIKNLFHSSAETRSLFEPITEEKKGSGAKNDVTNQTIKDFADRVFFCDEFNLNFFLKVTRKIYEKELTGVFKSTCTNIYNELFSRTLCNGDLFLNIIKKNPITGFEQEQQILFKKITQYIKEQRWTDSDTPTITSLLDHGIKDEKVRIEIAKIVAVQDEQKLSKYIQNYSIIDQEALIEIAKIAAAQDGRKLSKYIQNYGIKSEGALIEIAKIAAAKDGGGTSLYIQNYGTIEDQKVLIEIAKIAAAQDSWGTSLHIQQYGIKSEAARIDIAKIAAAKSGWGTSQYIQNYNIADQEGLIEIAKIAAHSGWGTSQYIQNYGIKSEAVLIEIAKIAAMQNGSGTSLHIQKYGIKSEAARIDIAKIAAAQSGWGTSLYIQNYDITIQEGLIEIAKIAAAQNGLGASLYIQKYGITSEVARIEIAKIAAALNGRRTSQDIENYDITAPEALIEIAKIAATQIIFRDISITKLIKKLKYLFYQFEMTKLLMKEASLSNFKEYFNGNRRHRPCCEWGYRMLNALPTGLSEANLQERIRYIIGIVLSMEGNRVSLQEIHNLSEQNDLHKALLELPDPKMRRSLFQYLADLPKKGAVEIFCQWIDSLNLSENLSKNQRKVKSIQISAALILASRCEQKTALALLNKIDRHFIHFQNRNLLLNTLELIVKSHASRDQVDQILKGLFSLKDSKSIVHALNTVKGIFSFGKASDLATVGHLNFDNEERALKEIKSLFSKAFIEAVHLENKEIENFPEKYEKTFGKFRDPEAIKKYAATLNRLPSEERQSTLSLLGEYIVRVLEGSFKEWRYENSAHLKALWTNNKKLQSDWKNIRSEEPLEKFLRHGSVEGNIQKLPNFQQLIESSFTQKHISNDKYPHIYNYLFFKDQREQIMGDLIHVMKSKNLDGSAEEKNQLQQQKERLKFQKMLIRLVEIPKNPLPVKEILNFFKKIQAYREIPSEFKNDILAWRNGLENSLKAKNPQHYQGWTCGFSDDACDLLLCGTEVDGSCQRVDGDSYFNKCLLAYMCDGKNQLVVIKDRSGRIQARGVIRLLKGKGGEPVLFLERFYPAILAEDLEEALVRMAVEAAKGLGLPLLSKQIKINYLQDDYQGVIRSSGGIALFEYSDVIEDICRKSKFEIADTFYVCRKRLDITSLSPAL